MARPSPRREPPDWGWWRDRHPPPARHSAPGAGRRRGRPDRAGADARHRAAGRGSPGPGHLAPRPGPAGRRGRGIVPRGGRAAVGVDAAQAFGHADTACGADAIYATSRKWLTGPRGVGLGPPGRGRQADPRGPGGPARLGRRRPGGRAVRHRRPARGQRPGRHRGPRPPAGRAQHDRHHRVHRPARPPGHDRAPAPGSARTFDVTPDDLDPASATPSSPWPAARRRLPGRNQRHRTLNSSGRRGPRPCKVPSRNKSHDFASTDRAARSCFNKPWLCWTFCRRVKRVKCTR